MSKTIRFLLSNLEHCMGTRNLERLANKEIVSFSTGFPDNCILSLVCFCHTILPFFVYLSLFLCYQNNIYVALNQFKRLDMYSCLGKKYCSQCLFPNEFIDFTQTSFYVKQ